MTSVMVYGYGRKVTSVRVYGCGVGMVRQYIYGGQGTLSMSC